MWVHLDMDFPIDLCSSNLCCLRIKSEVRADYSYAIFLAAWKFGTPNLCMVQGLPVFVYYIFHSHTGSKMLNY